MKYKLIAFDMDGTLVNRDGAIPAATIGAIKQAMSQGVQVTLATGRMFRSAARCARQLGVTIPIISYQGSLVADPVSGKILQHTPMSIAVVKEAIEIARQAPVHLNIYMDDELYVDEITDGLKRYAERNGVEPHLVSDLVSCLTKDPTKLMVWGDPTELDKVCPLLTERLSSRCLITRSYPTLCEVGHSDTGKGNALKFLSGLLGIEQRETVAVGDGLNDIDMIEWAGLGVVIDTAPEAVKTMADWIVKISPEDGLAELVTRICNLNGI